MGAGYVYLIKPVGHNVYKIGCTTNLERRIKQVGKKIKREVELVHFIKSNNCEYAEQECQSRFSHSHLVSEWFIMTEEEVNKFKSIEVMNYERF